MRPKLLNYTSQVSHFKSISYIERRLSQNGATKIMKEYSPDGEVISISFAINQNSNEIPFKLPARIKQCEKILMDSIRKPRRDTIKRVKEQAQRTAWKIISDWVDVQMAMVELHQAEILEVFLPYAFNSIKNQTYFEAVKEKGFKALLPAGA